MNITHVGLAGRKAPELALVTKQHNPHYREPQSSALPHASPIEIFNRPSLSTLSLFLRARLSGARPTRC